MSAEVISAIEGKMARAVEIMERDFQGLRTGRASTSLVERLVVEYYGTPTPLNQIAGISVPEAHQIVIQPWDRSVLGAIEKAIQKSDIGLTPNVDGSVVRLNIPPLTEERRRDIVKSVHRRMEEAKVEIRNHRREAGRHAQEGREGRQPRDGRRPSRARPAPEGHRPVHCRGRSPRGPQGTRGDGGLVARLVARTPLARPTDAPPIAHAPSPPVHLDPAQTGVEAPDRLASAEETPRHVAIIMDGNRRWARAHGLTELEGHAAGVETIRSLLKHAVRRGIPILSLYAFSRENWARTDEEVSGLFVLLESAIRDETDELRRQGVRIRLLGRLEELPEETQHSIDSGLSATAQGERLLLNIAFNYAGRTEIVDAVRRIVASGIPAGDVDERAISDSLYTVGLPDPDLVIRTGGDQRMSNFLVWQAAYAEFYFCSKLWPDFDSGAFDAALIDYASRLRRFGR